MEKQKLNFSRSALFHKETKASLKYFQGSLQKLSKNFKSLDNFCKLPSNVSHTYGYYLTTFHLK